MIKKNEIIRFYGTDYKKMTLDLLKKADLISLIPEDAKTIGIKPNLVTPTPASYGATTHPEIIAGIIEYLQAFRPFQIVIAEGSWIGDKTSEAFEYCGYNSLAETYGATLLDTQKDSSFTVSFPDAQKEPVSSAGREKMKLHINQCVRSFDFLINVPVLKGHCQTKITCALKNMKGLIPNAEKRRFHTMGLHKPIALLNTCIHQDFIVVDHICGDLDFEEGGNPVTRNCIMAARDPVLTDAYVCKLMGYRTSDVKYVDLSEQFGTGSTDLSALELSTFLQEGFDPENIEPFDLKDAKGQPSFKAGEKILAVSYAVDEIDSCSACYGMLIPALARLKEEGLLDDLHTKIGIGQGHRGKTGRLGVGNCTSGFDFFVKGCPPSEETIYEALKTYITEQTG